MKTISVQATPRIIAAIEYALFAQLEDQDGPGQEYVTYNEKEGVFEHSGNDGSVLQDCSPGKFLTKYEIRISSGA